MSDEAAPAVDVVESPKAAADLLVAAKRRDALAKARAAKKAKAEVPPPDPAPTPPGVAPLPPPLALPIRKAEKVPTEGFLSWRDFCEKVSVELVTNQFWAPKVGRAGRGTWTEIRQGMEREPGPFFNVLRQAYLCALAAYVHGKDEFSA